MGIRSKFDNFWYHHKWETIIIIFLLFVTIFSVRSCTTNTEADMRFAYISKAVLSEDSIDNLENALKQKGLLYDIDGDGKEVFYVDNISMSFDVDSNTDSYNAQKLQLVLFAGEHTLMLVHQYALEDYEGAFEDITTLSKEQDVVYKSADSGAVTGISVEGNSFLEAQGIVTEDLYIAMRKPNEKDKNNEANRFLSAYKVMDYILSVSRGVSE